MLCVPTRKELPVSEKGGFLQWNQPQSPRKGPYPEKVQVVETRCVRGEGKRERSLLECPLHGTMLRAVQWASGDVTLVLVTLMAASGADHRLQ